MLGKDVVILDKQDAQALYEWIMNEAKKTGNIYKGMPIEASHAIDALREAARADD